MKIILIANNIFIKDYMIDEIKITKNDIVVLFGKYELNIYNKVRPLTNNLFLFLRGRANNDKIKWWNYFKKNNGLFEKILFTNNHFNENVKKNINKTMLKIKAEKEIIYSKKLYSESFNINFENQQPTTGLIAIEYFIKKGFRPIILGFTNELRHGSTFWSGHNGSLEKEIINNLAKNGKLTKYYCTKVKTTNKTNINIPNIKVTKRDRLKLEYILISLNE